MSGALQIRLATVADMDEVMRLALLAAEDNSFMDFNPSLLAAEIYPALCLDQGMFAVIGPPGGAIEGFVLVRFGKMFYSDSLCLEERCLWVHPDYRSAKGGRASKLLDFTKKAADTLGLPLIIGILSTKRAEGKTRMYERKFGKPAGAFFLYGAKCGTHVAEKAT
jgi:GNAT superfamily N-acetyltransferase